MRDEEKTKAQLIAELNNLREKLAPPATPEGRLPGVGRVIAEFKRTLEAIEQSKRKHKEFIDSLPQAVYEIDLQGRFRYMNPAGLRLFGYSDADIASGLFTRDLLPADQTPQSIENIQALSSGTHFSVTEYDAVRKDGSTVPVVAYSVPHVDSDRVIGVRGVCVDISAQRQLANSLRTSEERYRAMFTNMKSGMAVYRAVDNGDDFVFVDFNPAAEQISRIKRDDVLGRSLLEKFPNMDKTGLFSSLQRVYQSILPEHIPAFYYQDANRQGWRENFVFKLPSGEVAAIYDDVTDHKMTEATLKLERQRFQKLAENSPFGMVVIQSDGTFSYANPKFEEMFGYDLQEVPTGRNWLRKAYPDSTYRHQVVSAWLDDLREVAAGETRPRIFVVTCKDGSSKITFFRPVKLDSDEQLMTCEDITERKLAEDEIKKLASIVQHSSELVNLANLDGQMIFINQAGSRILGIDPSQVEKTNIIDVIPDHLKEKIRTEILSELMQNRSWKGELQYVNLRTGKLTDVHAMTFAIPDPVTGKPLYLANVSRDITNRKRAEEALRESEQKYRALFEESMDGIFITEIDGTLLDANRSFFELFGYTRDEMVGNSIIRTYADPTDRIRFQQEMAKQGFVKDYSARLVKKDGQEIEALISARARADVDGTILGYRGIIRDMTEQKALEKRLLQAQKMEAVGTLAGGIAHDFNNLLQVMLGYSQALLMSKKPDDWEYGKLQHIYDAAQRGRDLIQQLLAFSRKSAIHRRSLDLNQQIRATKNLLDRTIPKMIHIVLDLDDNIGMIHADPNQIEQILMNLAINARDAMPEGGTLTIATKDVELDQDDCRIRAGVQPGRYAGIIISDSGHGMEKNTLDHIFEPFYTTKRVGEGTGLGLAMVYGIVDQNGGFIDCESTPGQGTTFRIHLPVTGVEMEVPALTDAVPVAGGAETILLVDDEEFVLELVSDCLEQMGYTVVTATNGREALQIYRENGSAISLVILDLIMPEMGGFQCFQELVKMNSQVRVIIASGLMSEKTQKDAERLGSRGFVQKPYDMGQLVALVRQTLDE